MIVSVPLSTEELKAYRRHPATFFERIESSAGKTIETPFKTFIWLLETHKSNARTVARKDGWGAQFRYLRAAYRTGSSRGICRTDGVGHLGADFEEQIGDIITIKECQRLTLKISPRMQGCEEKQTSNTSPI